MQVHLEAVHVPQHAHGADPALDLGLVGDVALPLGNVRLLVVPLQMGHDLCDVLGGERAEVALKRIPRYIISHYEINVTKKSNVKCGYFIL